MDFNSTHENKFPEKNFFLVSAKSNFRETKKFPGNTPAAQISFGKNFFDKNRTLHKFLNFPKKMASPQVSKSYL